MMEGDLFYYARATTAVGYGAPEAGGPPWGLRRWNTALYAQDDFKVTRRLTLNLGVRYEYASVPWEVADRLSDPEDFGPYFGKFVLNPQPFWQPDYISGDFDPRFGFALSLGKSTSLRGGWGLFTNMIPTIYADQPLTAFPLAAFGSVPGAQYALTPQPLVLPPLTTLSGQPIVPNGNTRQVAPNTVVNLTPQAAVLGPIMGEYASDRLKNGYTMSGNFTLEHEFPGGIQAQASYVANNGVDLYYSRFANAYLGAELQYAPYTQVTPGLGEVGQTANGAYSSYNGLQMQVHKTSPSHGLQFQANYTWSKDMTDADSVWSSGGVNGGVDQTNPQCLKCEYSRASYSVGQRFAANFAYNLPFSHWQALSRAPGRLTQGWQVFGIFTAQSGFPFSVTTSDGTMQYGFDAINNYGARPFLLANPTLHSNIGGQPQFFSDAVIGPTPPGGTSPGGIGTGYFSTPTAFSPGLGSAALTSPGNLGRNPYTGPSWSNLDFSIIKDTKITETKLLQFRAEFFNVLNHATFATPGEILGASNFGLSTSTQTPERQVQFGLRLIF